MKWTVIAVNEGVDRYEDVYSITFDAPLPAIACAIAGNVEARGTMQSFCVVPPGGARRVGGGGLYRLAEEHGIGADELDAAVAAKLDW